MPNTCPSATALSSLSFLSQTHLPPVVLDTRYTSVSLQTHLPAIRCAKHPFHVILSLFFSLFFFCKGSSTCQIFAISVNPFQTYTRRSNSKPGYPPLSSNSARSGYATKGVPPSLLCICPPKQRPLYCLRSFSTSFFINRRPCNSLSEFAVQHCFKCSASRWLEISWFSHGSSVLTKRPCIR